MHYLPPLTAHVHQALKACCGGLTRWANQTAFPPSMQSSSRLTIPELHPPCVCISCPLVKTGSFGSIQKQVTMQSDASCPPC